MRTLGDIWYNDISRMFPIPMTIVNDNSRVINKLETSLSDDTRVVIYNCHMFIVGRPLGIISFPTLGVPSRTLDSQS